MAGGDEGRTAKWWVPWVLLAPGGLWLVVFFLVPLISLGSKSLNHGGFSNYRSVFSDNGEIIIRTFEYSIVATLVALALGYPLAYVIAMRGGRFKNVLLAAVVLPFFVTYLIRTLAWKILLNDSGPVVGFLRWTGMFSSNGQILGEPVAVVGALVYNFLPFMVLPIYVSLEKVDKRLLEAGRDLFATPARTFRKVTLPLSIPGVFAGSLLTFIPATGDFVNSELLGSDRTKMIGNIIEQRFNKEVFRPQVSALSFVLMLLILVGVLIYSRLLGTEDLM